MLTLMNLWQNALSTVSSVAKKLEQELNLLKSRITYILLETLLIVSISQ